MLSSISVISNGKVKIPSSSTFWLSILAISGGLLLLASTTSTFQVYVSCWVPLTPFSLLKSISLIVILKFPREFGYHKKLAYWLFTVVSIELFPPPGCEAIEKSNWISSTSALDGSIKNEYSLLITIVDGGAGILSKFGWSLIEITTIWNCSS